MSKDFIKVHKEVTSKVLKELSRQSWMEDGIPNEWDINCGWCELWAMEMVEVLGSGKVLWLEEIDSTINPEEVSHAVLVWNGKYYDSQCIHGVKNIYDLPLVKEEPRSNWKRRM